MRRHGTLTKWNDDRGFGFITPAGGPPEVFVHISAFPRDGRRPQVGELISFELEAGKDGKQRAVAIMRPGQGSAARPARPPVSRRPRVSVLTAFALGGLAVFGYNRFQAYRPVDSIPPPAFAQSPPQTRVEPEPIPELGEVEEVEPPAQPEPALPMAVPARSPSSCDGRTMCSQMRSCEEATFFLRNCPTTKMDGDGDGVPCESQWCGR